MEIDIFISFRQVISFKIYSKEENDAYDNVYVSIILDL